MMSTRSIAGFTIVTAVMVAVLLSLGGWQLHRRDEKRALIAALSERLAAAPIPLPPIREWKTLQPARDEFRRVTLNATFVPKPETFVYSSGSALRTDVTGLGTFVFAPVRLANNEVVVINRGFVPEGQQNRAAAPPLNGPVTLAGYLRFPEQPGLFTPKADNAKRLWFARDHLAMAQAGGWGEVAPFYIDLEAPVPAAGGVPKPGPLQVHLKNDHLQYAITWFGLAAVVVIAFGVWLAGQRRLNPSR